MGRATVSEGRRTARSGGKAPAVGQKRGKSDRREKTQKTAKTGAPKTGSSKTGSPKTGSPKTGSSKTGSPKPGSPKSIGPKTARQVPAADPAVVDDRPRLRAAPPPIDHDIDPAVLEFISAIESYRHANARPFPSWSEVLHVLRQLGYKKA